MKFSSVILVKSHRKTHDHTISQRVDAWANQTSLTPQHFNCTVNCPYQSRKVSGHLNMCTKGIDQSRKVSEHLNMCTRGIDQSRKESGHLNMCTRGIDQSRKVSGHLNMCARGIGFACFYYFFIRFCNSSGSEVFFGSHYIITNSHISY